LKALLFAILFRIIDIFRFWSLWRKYYVPGIYFWSAYERTLSILSFQQLQIQRHLEP